MGVQPCLEKDSSCLSDGTDLLALDLTIVLENRRVLECGQECFLVSPTISYLLLQSKAVLTAYRASVSSSPILCSAILLNAMHIGDCYRDFPLRPACCRYPLVSRSRHSRPLCAANPRATRRALCFLYTLLKLELQNPPKP